MSDSNILSQGEILLRYTDSSAHEILKTRLFKEEARLKRDNVSMKFEMIECEVFPNQLMLELTGDLHAYVAHKKISTHRETYRVEFTSKSGRLFLKAFDVIKSDNKDLAHLSAGEDAFEEDVSTHEHQPHTESKEFRSQSLLVSSDKKTSTSLTEPRVEAINKDPKSNEESITTPSDSSSSIAPLAPSVVIPSIQENSHA